MVGETHHKLIVYDKERDTEAMAERAKGEI